MASPDPYLHSEKEILNDVWDPLGHELSVSGGGGGGGGNVNLNEVGGASYALGQTTKSGSLSVTIASDQSIGGGTQYPELATTTSATGTLALARYVSSAPTLTNGQMNEPLLDASGNLLTNVQSSALPTGAATASNQSTGNTSLSTIATDVAPLVASSAGGYVRQDSTATIAKESGGNLATTATNTTTLAGAVSSSKVNVNVSSGTVGTNADGSLSGGTPGTKSLAAGGVYNSSAPTLTNGQQSSIQLDSSGNLNVNVKAGSGSGLSVTDETSFTAGSSAFVPTGGVYNDSATLTSGQEGTVRLTSTRSMHTTTDNGALETGGNLATIATNTAATPSGSATSALQTTGNTSLSTIATDVAPLVASSGGGYIRQDSTATIAKETGGNLASVATNTSTTATNTSTTATNTTGLNSSVGSISGGTAGTKSLASGGVYNSTPPTLTNGQQASTQLDSSGNLKVNVVTGGSGGGGTQYTELATTTSATGTLALGRYSSSLPTLTNGQMNEPMLDSSSRLMVTDSMIPALGQTTASGSLPVTLASDSNGPVKLTDGTNTANIVAGDSGFNGVATTAGTKTYSFTTSATGAQTLLANTPTEGYAYITVQLTSAGSGLAWTAPYSATSGGTYLAKNSWWDMGNTSGVAGSLGISTATFYRQTILSNYFQLAISAMTGGTTTGYVVLSNTASIPPSLGVVATSTQSGTWTVNSTPQNSSSNGTITTSSSSIFSSTMFGGGSFAEISIHGTYSGVSFGITQSDDSGTTYYNVPIYDTTANRWLTPGSTLTPGTNASNLYWIPLVPSGCVIKVLASAYTSGTATVRIQQSGAAQPGSTMSQIMDAAGNSRGANVDANNNMNVSLSGTGAMPALAAGSNTIGSIANTSFAATQATASNLNATVVGTGTFAVQAAQSGSWTVGTTSAAVNVGQKTVSTTAAQLSATSTVPTNGIIVQALSTNSASIFVGGSGVTTSTGFELQAGQAISFTCNLNTLYIISAASTTDKACWNVE